MARVLHSLDLFSSNPGEAPRADSRPAPSKLQLWIAVCLPSLAFECLPATDARLPAVVVAAGAGRDAERGQLHVVAASRAAAEAGIASGSQRRKLASPTSSRRSMGRSP